MTIQLNDYAEFMEKIAPDVRDVIESTFQEASRVMSPASLQKYLEGGKGLCNLGRGTDPVISYLEEMPLVVKECGEDVPDDCIATAINGIGDPFAIHGFASDGPRCAVLPL